MEQTMNSNNETFKTTKADIYKIDPRLVRVEEGFNSRTDFGDLDELASQIKEAGMLNPISVIKTIDADGKEVYRLVDGERRYRATMKLLAEGVEIPRIPAIFLSKSLTAEQLLVQQLMRNEGKNFSEYEYGIAYQKFVDMGFTPKEIAVKVGKPDWHVSICLKQLDRDERVQALMRENRIEGATVRKIYQAHNGDEAGAVAEILAMANKVGNTGNEGDASPKAKKKITMDDLDKNSSKTIAVRDTAAIKKGLGLFIDYVNRFSQNNDTELDVDIISIYEALKSNNKKTIMDVFDELSKSYSEAV